MSIEKITIESRQELEQMITKDTNQVEKDLTLICSNVPINDKGTLDVLCHDNNGQLVILQMDINEDDIMLLHGLQSFDYVDKFKSFLKATYNKHKIDDKEKPRLILIAPSFSDALKRAVQSMQGMRIDLYEWEYLKLGDHKGLRLQPIFATKTVEKPSEEKQTEKKRETKPAKKKEIEPTPAPEKKEERPEEAQKPQPEPKEEPPKVVLPPVQKPPEVFKPEHEEPPRKKLRLF